MCIDNNKLLYLKPQTVKRKPVKITNIIWQAELFFPEFWCTFYRAPEERSVFCSQLGQHAFLTPSYYQFSGIHILKYPYLAITVLTLARLKPPFQGYEFVNRGVSVILPFSFSPNIVEASIEYKLYMTVEIPVYLSKQMLMSSLGNHYHIGIIVTFACHNEIH